MYGNYSVLGIAHAKAQRRKGIPFEFVEEKLECSSFRPGDF